MTLPLPGGTAVLLVDDHPLFRDGLVLALRQRDPALVIDAVGAVPEAEAALDRQPGRYGLALLDFRLPGTDGLRVAQQWSVSHTGLRRALITGQEDPTLVAQARLAGLDGFFPKTLSLDALLAGLRQILAGGSWWGEAPAAVPPAGVSLTLRQFEIVQLAAAGASNKEIARALDIAPHTVKNHLALIFEKLGAHNRAQAASRLQELMARGALPPPAA